MDPCTVVVIYDDAATRARALSACDYLVSQLWESVELDFQWWRTDFLSDPYMAEAAAHHAIASDFLILCSREAGQISTPLKNWLESWIAQRQSQEGALIDVTATPSAGHALRHRQNWLREIAARGRFDYLSAVPEESQIDALKPRASTPATQADQMATDDLPGRSRPPSHYGLND